MAKGKRKSSVKVNWLAETKRNEVIYGCETTPLWQKYSDLKDKIWRANNADVHQLDLSTLSLRENAIVNGSSHPYEDKIGGFALDPAYLAKCKNYVTTHNLESLFPNPDPIMIDDKEMLRTLINKLAARKHVYLDLENHNYRSYRGITPILQVSDGKDIYLVDTLKLAASMKLFEDIFLNPRIIKIFHAASNDIKWLEKDFSLYIVGLMDTQILFRELRGDANVGYSKMVQEVFPEAGLDKGVRNTDFRVRPLHLSQIKYAALDVYYLPYFYFKMVQQITETQLSSVVIKCRDISSLRFQFPNLLKNVLKPEDSAPLRNLKILRDLVARKEDVNPEFLCTVSSLERLVLKNQNPECKTVASYMHSIFLDYDAAIRVALKGFDPTEVMKTVYRDRGIPFPYRSPMFCFNCGSNEHCKRDCLEPRSLGKQLKKLHYQQHPEERVRQTRRRNANRKMNPEARRKHNIRTNRRKLLRRREKINRLFQ